MVGNKQCAFCGSMFVPSRGVGYRYCSKEHAASAKRERDNARPAPSAEERARWNATYRTKHIDQILVSNRASKKRMRAEHGREDRTAEYIKREAKKGKVYMSMEDRRKKAAAAELARRILVAVRRDARKVAVLKARALRPSEAEQWRSRYRNDPVFRQSELQRLRKSKLKRKMAMESGLTAKQTIALYAERSTCIYCGVALADRDKTLDHMTPLSKGGLHEAFNLIVSCSKCNTKKASKAWAVWIECVATERRDLVQREFDRRSMMRGGDHASCKVLPNTLL